jgi:hypothetical protein
MISAAACQAPTHPECAGSVGNAEVHTPYQELEPGVFRSVYDGGWLGSMNWFLGVFLGNFGQAVLV